MSTMTATKSSRSIMPTYVFWLSSHTGQAWICFSVNNLMASGTVASADSWMSSNPSTINDWTVSPVTKSCQVFALMLIEEEEIISYLLPLRELWLMIKIVDG